MGKVSINAIGIKDTIIEEYSINMLSGQEIAKKYNLRKTSVYAYLKEKLVTRSKSSAALLALNKGDRPKNLEKLVLANKTYARFNPGKKNYGDKNGRWIQDRSKLKRKRGFAEERWFFEEVLEERNYTCEITGEKGGKLSVHHLYNFSTHPELRFEKSNVIVIKKDLHKLFHIKYSPFNNTPEQFKEFVNSLKEIEV